MEQAQEAAAPVDVDQLAIHVNQLASELHLVVIPAMPLRNPNGWGLTAFLEDLSAPDFCNLASTVGARLLYVDAEAFDAESEPEFDAEEHGDSEPDETVSAQLAMLRGEAERFNGRIGQLALAFVVEGVLHWWNITADWYDDLIDRIGELFPEDNLEAERLSETEAKLLIERLAGELIAIPEFRAATTSAQQQRVARAQHTEINALYEDRRPGYSRVAFRALQNAAELTAAQAERIYREMERNLPELAAELASKPEFRDAGTAGARKQRARDFLIEKTGGLPPTTRFFELFLDTPPIRKPKHT